MAGIGVALSGGGHRAALFGLGVLLYLVDAEKNREVTSIASVSGSSLTNGVVAQSSNFTAVTQDEFLLVAKQLATSGSAASSRRWALSARQPSTRFEGWRFARPKVDRATTRVA
jgi:hypothetical protein